MADAKTKTEQIPTLLEKNENYEVYIDDDSCSANGSLQQRDSDGGKH